MLIKDLTSYLEKLFPINLQESYDNSGLIIGDYEGKLTRVLVCLDVDEKAMDIAVKNKCELIVSHHPAIFKAIKSFTRETREGELLVKSIQNGISVFSMHTNYDSAKGGLTDILCDKLGVFGQKPIIKATPFDEYQGLGRYGDLSATIDGEAFINKLKTKLQLDLVRLIGDIPEAKNKVAVFNGSYDRDILKGLCQLGIDVLVTGDLKYHDAQELKEHGVFTIDAGHFGTEKLFVSEIASSIKNTFSDLNVIAHEGEDVFTYF